MTRNRELVRTKQASISIDKTKVEQCIAVLRALANHQQDTTDTILNSYSEVFGLSETLAKKARNVRKGQSHGRKSRDFDRDLVNTTGIRQLRSGVAQDKVPIEKATILRQCRYCYVCKGPYNQLHFFYDSLCPSCAQVNYQKRMASANLKGKVALVTGARIKIGYEIALKLLRAGALVIATTRFPVDALRRFAKEPDFTQWINRLHLYGLDMRHLPSVELFAQFVLQSYRRLDILINNAAQTVRRPRGFYANLIENEMVNVSTIPQDQQRAIIPNFVFQEKLRNQVKSGTPASNSASLQVHKAESKCSDTELTTEFQTELQHWITRPNNTRHTSVSVVLSQVAAMREDVDTAQWLFHEASPDRFGQPTDLRTNNSWRLSLSEVDTVELLEVHHVNVLAPYILTARLLPLMNRLPDTDKFIVQVSAVEGQFSQQHKTHRHPHTNMAKAALNMLTRTVAQSCAYQRVFMTSVDTGWVTNEQPHPRAQTMESRGFQPPLDEIDGAARVCDPIFTGILTGSPVWGCFLKDYRITPW